MKLKNYINKRRIIYYSILLFVVLVTIMLELIYNIKWLNGYFVSIVIILTLAFAVYYELKISVLKTVYNCIVYNKRYNISEIIEESKVKSYIVNRKIKFLIKKGFLENIQIVNNEYLKKIN